MIRRFVVVSIRRDLTDDCNASQIVGMNWVELPPGSYKIASEDEKRSHCQLEVSVRYASLVYCVLCDSC